MVCNTFFGCLHDCSEKAESFLQVQTSLNSGPQAGGSHFSWWARVACGLGGTGNSLPDTDLDVG